MKRLKTALCMLLAMAMVLSLLAGCQNESSKTVPELDETLQQVLDLGIADMGC